MMGSVPARAGAAMPDTAFSARAVVLKTIIDNAPKSVDINIFTAFSFQISIWRERIRKISTNLTNLL
jgi:hypothetical protein